MKKEKGAAIITILILLVVISILGFVFLETCAGDYIYSNIHKNNVSAYYLALAGVEYAGGEYENWQSLPYSETIELSTGKCLINAISLPQKQIQVECVGTPANSNISKTIYAVIKDGVVINWRQK